MDRNLCQSCGLQRNKLNAIHSRIFPEHKIIICGVCLENRYEPRSLVILGARQLGWSHVEEFIRKSLYHGEPIPAADVL